MKVATMIKKTLIFAVILFLAGLCTALSFVFPKEKGILRKTETVRIIQGGDVLSFLPQYIALWNGYFQEEKIKVEFIPVASENIFLSSLQSGRGDILAAGLEQAVYAHTDYGEKVVAFCALTKKDNTMLVARDEKPFQWGDLKGKTVVTGPPGSRKTVVFKGVLARQGLSPNRQVTLFTNIPLTLQAGAFKSGTGDYILLDEPEASLFEVNGLGKAVASLGDEVGELPAIAYLTTENCLQNRSEALQRFTSAIYKAQLWLKNNNAADVWNLVAEHLPAPKDEQAIKKGIEKYKALGIWAENPAISRENYERFLGLFLDAREIPRPVPYEIIVANSFAEKAVREITYQPEK
jgi:NitT/TauT family transport system substrate-binding protein